MFAVYYQVVSNMTAKSKRIFGRRGFTMKSVKVKDFGQINRLYHKPEMLQFAFQSTNTARLALEREL
jgi:hypothetical protein